MEIDRKHVLEIFTSTDVVIKGKDRKGVNKKVNELSDEELVDVLYEMIYDYVQVVGRVFNER